MKSQVEQAANRSWNTVPSVDEFILLRRRTIGGEIVEGRHRRQHHCPQFLTGMIILSTAMVEYSLDIKIPEYVWDHPVLVGLSRAAIDIMTWPNVSVSYYILHNLILTSL